MFSLLVIASHSAGAQIGVRPLSPGPKVATAHPADSSLIPTSVGLYLCVDGSTAYPCPVPVLSDRTIVSDIVITYGQYVSGNGQVSTAIGGTLTFYEDTTPFCTIPAVHQTYCASFGGPFDAGVHILTAVFSGDSEFAEATSNPSG